MKKISEVHTKSANIKIDILLKGIKIEKNAFCGLGKKFKEYQYGYNDSNWNNKETQEIIPSELELPGGIVVAPHIRPNSCYTIKRQGERLFVWDDIAETIISDISYLSRPQTWDLMLDDNLTSIRSILNIYGKDCLNLFVVAECDFWLDGIPCSFCSLQPTQLFHHQVIKKKKLEQIQEAVMKAFGSGDPLNWMIITGGSLKNRKAEMQRYYEVLNAISKVIPKDWNGKIKGNCAFLPAPDEYWLNKIYETGIEHPSFNIEVWGDELFEEHCKGKASIIGLDSILRSYEIAVKIWGEGKVWCNFVGGISAIDDLKKGFWHMAEMGVVPGANIFHLDPKATAVSKGLREPTREYVYEMYSELNKIYRKFGYLPFFNEGVLRNSLSNEFYNGWL